MIALVDVCGGNVRSVQRGLLAAGGDVEITRDPDAVVRADKVVVPGQGAFSMFARGMAGGLGDAIKQAIAKGTPYLGICLGLQVLFESSDEGPGAGLGVLRGRCVKLPTHGVKVPHIGWNRVRSTRPGLSDAIDGKHVYFVHSYFAAPHDDVIAMEAEHGVPFCAAVQKANIFACQFHPEKSQAVGQALLRRFVAS